MRKVITCMCFILCIQSLFAQVKITLLDLERCINSGEKVLFKYKIENQGEVDVYLFKDNMHFYLNLLDEFGNKVVGDRVLEVGTPKENRSDYFLLVKSKETIIHTQEFDFFRAFELVKGSVYKFESSYMSFWKKKRFRGIKVITDEIKMRDLAIIICK